MNQLVAPAVMRADPTIAKVSLVCCDLNEAVGYRWNPVLVRVEAVSGHVGWGEIGLAYGPGGQAVMAMAADYARGFVLGRDGSRPAALLDEAYRLGYWAKGGGPIVWGALSGLDIALWDLKGQMLGAPVHELLGGACHDTLPAYANGWFKGCASPEDFAQAAMRPVADGFGGIKFDPFKIGPNGKKDRPRRVLGGRRLDLAVSRVDAVRQAVGPDIDVLIDVHGALGVASANAAIQALVPYGIGFIEEVVDTANSAHMRKVSEAASIPIAAGERLYTRNDFAPFFADGSLDLVQPDVGLAGGITETRRIAEAAETAGADFQAHNCASPVLTAASVQLSFAVANTRWVEVFPYRPAAATSFVQNPIESRIEAGRIPLPEEPGLGITIDEAALSSFQHLTVS